MDSHGREVEKYDRSKLRSWKKAKVPSLKKVQTMMDFLIERRYLKITNEIPRWCISREESLVKWGRQLLSPQTRRQKRKRCLR